MKNKTKDVKDDDNVTNAQHDETNEKVDDTAIVISQSFAKSSNKT